MRTRLYGTYYTVIMQYTSVQTEAKRSVPMQPLAFNYSKFVDGLVSHTLNNNTEVATCTIIIIIINLPRGKAYTKGKGLYKVSAQNITLQKQQKH